MTVEPQFYHPAPDFATVAAAAVDLALAERFLTLLDEEAERWTFQTFDDNKERKDRSLARVFNGALEQHATELMRLNAAGAGVFVTVQKTDGRGRKSANIVAIRAVFQEADRPGTPEPPLEAHIIVESSPGKFHRYLLVEASTDFDLFDGVQARMVQDHGSDPNAKDSARVLRLPGFFHQKDPANPWLVRIIHESGQRPYTWAELTAAIPPLEKSHQDVKPLPPGHGIENRAKLDSALEALDPDMGYKKWLKVGMALHHASGGGEAGFEIWDQWSAKGRLYRPGETAIKWATFGTHNGKPAQLGSIFHLAKAAAWRWDKSNSTAPTTAEPETENALIAAVQEIAKTAGSALDADIALRELAEQELAKNAKATYTVLRDQYRELRRKLDAEAREIEARQRRQEAYERQQAEFEAQDIGPDEVLEELNSQHAVVCYANRVLIMSETIDPVLNRRAMAFTSAADFRLRYANRAVLIPTDEGFKRIPWAEFWLTHAQRRQYEGIVFLPGKTPAGYYNLWRGLAITPAPGECGRLKEHIFEVLCSGDAEKFDYFWRWWAHLFQRPAELPETAIVLRGRQGTGKNTVVDALGRILGRHYVPLTQTGQLCGRFSAHLMDAVLVFANEAVWGGDKQGEGSLKAMITDAESVIEAKGKDPIIFRNCKRIVAASNETWAVPRGIDDRRFFCLDVSPHRIGDSAYFKALYEELDNGGAAAMLAELLAVDLTDWHPRHSMPAGNTDGEDIKLESMSSALKFLLHCLMLGQNILEETDQFGRPYPGQPLWSTQVEKSILYGQYLDWCDRQRVQHRANLIHFSRELARAIDFTTGRAWGEGNRPRCYHFPDLATARQQFQSRVANIDFDE